MCSYNPEMEKFGIDMAILHNDIRRWRLLLVLRYGYVAQTLSIARIIIILCVALGIPMIIVAAMALMIILQHPDFLRFGINFFHSDLLPLSVVGGIWIVMMQYSLVGSILRYTDFPGSLSLSRVKKPKVNDIVTVLLSAWISDKRTVLCLFYFPITSAR